MTRTLPVARPGDVCILVEPDVEQLPQLRGLQQQLQADFGGRPQQRIHFTCQRFALREAGQLPAVVQALQEKIAPLPPLTVRARCVELVEHPFWEFSVLRWDLHRNREMFRFAEQVTAGLESAGLAPHYPCGDGWRPHVTALEAIPSANGASVNGAHAHRFLYTGRRVTLSQVQEGKRFEILATVEMNGVLRGA